MVDIKILRLELREGLNCKTSHMSAPVNAAAVVGSELAWDGEPWRVLPFLIKLWAGTISLLSE